ncbi:MAG: YggT family protein [Actinomycetota bacterium]|jgi:YggT family protein|nr:YggT family protein [Actinomycetota bacterium]
MQIVCYAISVYWVILILRIILSWVQAFGGRVPAGLDPLVRVIYELTEPVLGLFRRYIPPVGMFDISVLFVFLILGAVQRGLCA